MTQELERSIGRLIAIADGGDAGAAFPPNTEHVPKPVRQDDILARVQAALPPTAATDDAGGPEAVSFAGFTLDFAARTCKDLKQNLVALTRAGPDALVRWPPSLPALHGP